MASSLKSFKIEEENIISLRRWNLRNSHRPGMYGQILRIAVLKHPSPQISKAHSANHCIETADGMPVNESTLFYSFNWR